MTTRVLVLSDTHAPRFWKRPPPELVEQLRSADLILHAGDVCVASVLDELRAYAPVRVVQGNNDGPDVAAWGATETVELDVESLSVGMVHDSGPKNGRAARLRRRFPTAHLVVFGHSHIPWLEVADDQTILNPGSPTDKRRQPRPTYAWVSVDGAQLVDTRIVEL